MNLVGRSVLDIPQLSRDEILFLLDNARKVKSAFKKGSGPLAPLGVKSAALLFFEPSTRTRTSFEMACFRLGLRVLNLAPAESSQSKGETIFDTARNIEALSPDVMIIRHQGSGVPEQVAKIVKCPVINAGDGFHAHPTQALLDAFTIAEDFGGKFEGLRVLIVGDIAHSRVARSNIHCLRTLGARITVCGPRTLIPPFPEELGVEATDKLDQALPEHDVIMLLRMQIERQNSFQVPSLREYTTRFGIDEERMSKMKAKSILMHPGPVNRGTEVTSSVLRDPRSRVLTQVENGVAMRTTLLASVLGVGVV
jgi:aspartate carbamoyltransferase catalytic subunit